MKPIVNLTLMTAATLAVVSSAMAGSLWDERTTNEKGMYADKRAGRVGDIITIVVQENTTATNSLTLSTNKTSALGTSPISTMINNFITALPASILGKNKVAAAANTAAGATTSATSAGTANVLPQLSANGTTTYTGGGTINNAQTANSRAAVTVIDVLPNGNMVVEGVRLVRFSKEAQYASLRGIVRPADIQADNSVLSTNVADAQVEFVSEGTLTDEQKKGWLLRLENKVSPF